jgi:general secretion pathway protein C
MKKDGIMKHLFSLEMFKKILALLVILLMIKTLWFIVEVLWLPSQGIDHEIQNNPRSLYYRVKLTPNQSAAPVVAKKSIVVKTEEDMKNIKLLAIYGDSEVTIVTVSHKSKTKVLSRGDNINGFVLRGAGLDYATFTKNTKHYKVMLLSPKALGKGNTIVPVSSGSAIEKSEKSEVTGEVTDLGDRKVIDRSLLEHYANNMDDIYKNIGITEVKNGRNLEGFRLTFVRKDSPFAKLGVRRDDIIKEINGQPITSYNAAFEVYKNIKNVENLSLKIKRGKEEMELEYEIN